MVCFKSTSKAVMASINIQRDFQKYREDNSDIPLHVRIGVNAGEPVTQRDDFLELQFSWQKEFVISPNPIIF